MKYFITYNGSTIGPMSIDQIFSYPIDANTPICTDEDQTWRPLYTYPDLMSILNNTRRAGDYSTTDRNRIICGLFAIFLGYLGVQYFYLGKIQAGIISIILSIVTCGLWSVVTFIQGICMMAMSQPRFEEKYVYTKSTFPVF